MKLWKVLIILAAALLTGFAWYSNISGAIQIRQAIREYVGSALSSESAGLYEQAVEEYKKALKLRRNMAFYQSIQNVYSQYYAEEPTEYVRSAYIADMLEACAYYPSNASFWVTAIQMQIENKRLDDAFSTIVKSRKRGIKSEDLDRLYIELLYSEQIRVERFEDFQTALNGYFTVQTGGIWKLIDDRGQVKSKTYDYIAPPNIEYDNIIKVNGEMRLIDAKGVTRGRYRVDADNAGIYSQQAEAVPLHMDKGWAYITLGGAELPGVYEIAGSFADNAAAVKSAGKWSIIDQTGSIILDTDFEDIKLDPSGWYVQSGVILAKKRGVYNIYDKNFKQISSFACDDIGVCLNSEPIAFASNGKWGFVDTSGHIVAEPRFEEAKSFSHGLAAVNSGNGWGFINKAFEPVQLKERFAFAHYFTAAGTCMIQMPEDNAYRLLELPFINKG